MNRSESIVNLTKSLLAFQSSLSSIGKDAVNPFHKNKYASLTNILDNINDLLASNGILVMQPPVGSNSDFVTLRTVLIHAATGEFMEFEFCMVPVKRDPQGIGSCITYMRRYALTSILKLNVDDDDDGNAASNANGRVNNMNKEMGLSSDKKSEPSNSAMFTNISCLIEQANCAYDLLKIADMIQKNIKSDSEKSELRKIYRAACAKINEMEGRN